MRPDQALGRPGRGDPLEGRTPHEVVRLVELHHAPEPGVIWVRLAIELVAVERHPGLESERVPRAEAHRNAVGGLDGAQQHVPELDRPAGLDEDLEAVLARIAGSRDEGRDPGHLALRDGVVAQGRQVDPGQRGEDRDGPRPLDGQQAGRERAVVEDRPEAGQALGERIRDDGRIAGVGDDQEPLLGQAIDDEVVDDAAVGRHDHRVVGAPDRECRWVRHQGRGQGRTGVRALHEQLAHVRQVEQPDSLTDGPMLVEDRSVLDRHQPAAEFDQPGAEGGVTLCEGCAMRLVGRRLGRLAVGHEPAGTESGSTSSAARATRARSVSNVRVTAASANGIQRTSSNSWSCRARSPPMGSIMK